MSTYRRRLQATHDALADVDRHLATAGRLSDQTDTKSAIDRLILAVSALRDAVGTIEARLMEEEQILAE